MWQSGHPFAKVKFQKVAAPLLKLIFPWKSGCTYINKMLKKRLPLFEKGLKKVATPLRKQIFKKWPPLVLPFTKGKRQSGFCYLKAICDWRGWFQAGITYMSICKKLQPIIRDCHGFTNLHGSWVWVGDSHPQKNPHPWCGFPRVSWVQDLTQIFFFFFLRNSPAKLLFTNIILYYIKYFCNSSWNWSKTVKNEWKWLKMSENRR